MKKYIFFTLFAIANIVFASLLVRYSEAGPIATGAYRLLLAIPFLLILDMKQARNNSYSMNRQALFFAICAGIFFAFDLAVYNISILYTTLAEATLLTNMVPFVIAPISVIVFKERIHPKFIIAVILAIIGLSLLTHSVGITKRNLIGDWLALLSAVFYALFLLNMKKASENYYVNRIMIIVCCSGGAILMLLAFMYHEVILARSIFGWAILLAIVLCGQILGQTLLAQAIKFTPIQLASLFLLLSPVFAAIYAYIFFNEKLHIMQLSGMAIILVAVYYGKQILEASLKKPS